MKKKNQKNKKRINNNKKKKIKKTKIQTKIKQNQKEIIYLKLLQMIYQKILIFLIHQKQKN